MKALRSPFRWPPLTHGSSVIVGLPTCFGLVLVDQAGAALADENRKERGGAGGHNPVRSRDLCGRLPSPGPCAPFSVAVQDPAEVRKPDRGGLELRICSGISNARWESLKLHLFCSPCSHHRGESHLTLQLPCSCEPRSSRGPLRRTRGVFRMGATRQEGAAVSTPS